MRHFPSLLLFVCVVTASIRSGDLDFDSSALQTMSSTNSLIVIDWTSDPSSHDVLPSATYSPGPFITSGLQVVEVLTQDFWTSFHSTSLRFAYLSPSLKIAPELTASFEKETKCQQYNLLFITKFSSVSSILSELSSLVLSDSFTPLDNSEDSLVVEICSNHLSVISKLSHYHSLIWIEPHPDFHTFNCHTSSLIEGDSNGPPAVGGTICRSSLDRTSEPTHYPLSTKGITGKKQLITVIDSGLDTNHCFFKDSSPVVSGSLRSSLSKARSSTHRKVLFYDNEFGDGNDSSGHGTHVAGTAAGSTHDANSAFQSSSGVAPGAKLIIIDAGKGSGSGLSIPRDIVNRWLVPSYSLGSRIFSNSWGSTSRTSPYTSDAATWDSFVVSNPEALVLFAAGNSGQSGTRTIGSPATAKNALAVGASLNSNNGIRGACAFNSAYCRGFGLTTESSNNNQNVVSFFSSRGPTDYGSIKPDLVAPGLPIASARSGTSCSLTLMAGTSMATPAVAGAAALLREVLLDQGINPRASLMRSLLVGLAVPLESVGGKVNWNSRMFPIDESPSTIQGFGRVTLKNVYSSLVLVNEDTTLTKSNPMSSHCFKAKSRGRVAVTLAWNDPPSFPGCKSCIVNQLSLEVVDGSGNVISSQGLPFQFGTVNRIVIPSANGNYRVIVRGQSLSTTQTFSLSVVGNVDSLACPSASLCPSNCNNKGTCSNGACQCSSPSLNHFDCSSACKNDCSNRGNCAKGSCVCEFPYLGDNCSKFHSLGDSVARIGSSDEVVFKLQEGLGKYKAGVDNTWHFIRQNIPELSLKISNIQLGSGDSVVVYTEKAGALSLVEHNFYVTFQSDPVNEGKGFSLKAFDPSTHPIPGTSCDPETTFDDDFGSFSAVTPADCQWKINNNHDKVVELNFNDVILANGDSVDIYWTFRNRPLLLHRISKSITSHSLHSLYPLIVEFNGKSSGSSFSSDYVRHDRSSCPPYLPRNLCRGFLTAKSAVYSSKRNLLTITLDGVITPSKALVNCSEIVDVFATPDRCFVDRNTILVHFSDDFSLTLTEHGSTVLLVDGELATFTVSELEVEDEIVVWTVALFIGMVVFVIVLSVGYLMFYFGKKDSNDADVVGVVGSRDGVVETV
ncbi:hypothetical protein GEMRC1_007332 [Eukaryota sp. GEM-RC1]